MTLRNRLQRLEVAYLRRLLDTAGPPYGVSADDLLEEARQLLALPLAAQLAAVEQAKAELWAAGYTDADLAHIRNTLTRYDRPVEREQT